MLDLAAIKSNVQGMMEEHNKLREVAHTYLVPKKDTEESKDTRRMANAYAAAEVVVALYSIFQGLRNPSENAMYNMLNDLTVALNTNPFWGQYAGTLMPLFIASVNAANDARQLQIEAEPRWKDLEAQARCLWVEMLPTIVFLVHGYGAMRAVSVDIKKTFLGFMYG